MRRLACTLSALLVAIGALCAVPMAAQAQGSKCTALNTGGPLQLSVCIDGNSLYPGQAVGLAPTGNSNSTPITIDISVSTQACYAGNINNCANVSGTYSSYPNWVLPGNGIHRFDAGTVNESFGYLYRGCVFYSVHGGSSGGGCSPMFN